MKYHTVTISTKELQDALREYCVNVGVIPAPGTVLIQSHNSEISVELAPGGMITADEFHHAAIGA